MAYIERAYLTEQFESRLHDDNVMCPVMKVLDALEIVDTAPSADVEEVKHGKWLVIGKTKGRSNILQCSACGKVRKGVGKSAYCRDCGAKMDGGNAE